MPIARAITATTTSIPRLTRAPHRGSYRTCEATSEASITNTTPMPFRSGAGRGGNSSRARGTNDRICALPLFVSVSPLPLPFVSPSPLTGTNAVPHSSVEGSISTAHRADRIVVAARRSRRTKPRPQPTSWVGRKLYRAIPAPPRPASFRFCRGWLAAAIQRQALARPFVTALRCWRPPCWACRIGVQHLAACARLSRTRTWLFRRYLNTNAVLCSGIDRVSPSCASRIAANSFDTA